MNYASGNARVGAQIGHIGTVLGGGKTGGPGLPPACPECGGTSWDSVTITDGRVHATCANCQTTHTND